jgi:hypothetical protein
MFLARRSLKNIFGVYVKKIFLVCLYLDSIFEKLFFGYMCFDLYLDFGPPQAKKYFWGICILIAFRYFWCVYHIILIQRRVSFGFLSKNPHWCPTFLAHLVLLRKA